VSTVLLVSILLVPASALGCAGLAYRMRRHHVGQFIREAGPTSHHAKAGTPTMGGAVLLLLWAVAVSALSLVGDMPGSSGFVLTSGTAFAAIGALDDLLSLRRRRSMGLSGRWKVVLSVAIAAGLYGAFRESIASTLSIPFSTGTIDLPSWAAFLLTVVVFLATTNALNLTDGLDGLAGACSVLILVGSLFFPSSVAYAPVVLPLAAVVVGFLWVNAHPARLILGDIGSYLLGGAIAAIALGQGTALALPLLAGVPVLEAASVLLQIPCWKLFHRRLFRMAPLHHHFEGAAATANVTPILPSAEWKETTIVTRFVVAQAAFVGVAVLALTFG